MSEAKKSGDEYLFEITSFLITSTKRCLGPEYMYGAGRLMQTLNLLSYLPEYVPDLKGNKLLMKTREFIERDEHWWYADKFTRFIEEISADLVKEMKKRLDKIK